jgi:hypothetical protein
MIQNIFVFALLFVSSGVYGSAANAAKHVHDVKSARQLTQKMFRKTAQAKSLASIESIKTGKAKSTQIPPHEMVKEKVVAEVPKALRGASAHAGHVETESLTSAKTRIFSPNKGFLEYTLYDDRSCSSATAAYGTGVNYCYYDEDTGGATADVVVIKKLVSGYQYIETNSFVFSDSYCTSLDSTSTSVGYSGDIRANCYNVDNDDGSLDYSFTMDHVTTPTNVTSDTTFGFYEYKTTSQCNNWNSNGLISYSSVTPDDFGCVYYFLGDNTGEYFKLACSDSVVKAQIYSDDSCSTYLRDDDLDLCNTEYFTYASRLVCESSA